MLRPLTYRKIVWLIVLLAAICTGGSFYAQYGLGLNPCPLCIFQRMSVIGVGLLALLCALWPLRRRLAHWASALLVSVPALFGLGVAIRQRYIQGLPPAEIPACGPGLNFMVETMPFADVLQKVLLGSGECATVEYVLGVPLPIWSMLFFSAVLLLLWGGLWFTRSRR